MSVTHLKAANFKVTRDGVYINQIGFPGMLLIWADFCGHCHRFMPTYEQIAQSIGDEFKCMAIENNQFKNSNDLSTALEFKYFPTIKFFDQTGKIIGTYPSNEPREFDQLMKYICNVYHHCTLYH